MRRSYLITLAFALLFAGVARAQFPVLDAIADKVIQKYQSSTCEQLWQQKGAPKPPMEQKNIWRLRASVSRRLMTLATCSS